jgi:hypothetical protein
VESTLLVEWFGCHGGGGREREAVELGGHVHVARWLPRQSSRGRHLHLATAQYLGVHVSLIFVLVFTSCLVFTNPS